MNFFLSLVRKDLGSTERGNAKHSGLRNRNAEKRIRVIVDAIGRSEDRG